MTFSDVERNDPEKTPGAGDNCGTNSEDGKHGVQFIMWKYIDSVIQPVLEAVKEHKVIVKQAILLFALLLYLAGLIYACSRDFEKAKVMLILTGLAVCAAVYTFIRDFHGEAIWKNILQRPVTMISENMGSKVKWTLCLVFLIIVIAVVVVLCRENPKQLVSAGGLVVFILITYVTSKYPRQVLPVVIYFSTVISVLYYLGVMQVIIKKIAWLMQKTMQTSGPESLNAAGNIFVGQTEAPLLIRPMIKDMTKSELHAVMTGGFATIAGGVLGAFIAFGISASHLLSASVMSAPAALAISKLFYPETEKSRHADVDKMDLPKGEQRNIIEAASYGAYTAIPLALNIAGNLIAFIALLALMNGILGYIGGLLGWDELSFEFICSYVFVPLALLMGVEVKDCRIVAELLGYKTFLNEFVAYGKLAEYITNRQNESGDYMSIRSEIIATYALCGFSNFSSIGIQLGGLTPMAPERRGDLASVALRALIAGSIACFMTACIAGVLYDESTYDAANLIGGNTTET
ncbi:putative solute carrier family 28 member 3-like [Apostichopus japonicus]|uniref:Putative solute carrier family 28 member 3-like n=1 Tax=Stichopus japonicus TaxID=307972 RepID=A0A2G8LP92_STIJA|nr:putative solute carrier family 28 member 3-like [Apostichopus japonicus]